MSDVLDLDEQERAEVASAASSAAPSAAPPATVRRPLGRSECPSRHHAPPAVPAPRPGDRTERSLSLVTIAWIFGSVHFTMVAGAPMTLFAERLGATPFVFGLLAAAPFAASLLSLPAAIWSDYSGRRKGIFLWSLYLHRLLWLPIAILPPLLLYKGVLEPPAALGLFVALITLMHCCGAVGGPAWMSWMADVIPRRVRGRYFARRRQWGIVSALPAALVVGVALDYFARGAGASQWSVFVTVGAIFCVAAVFGLVDIALFQFVPHERPPAPPVEPARETARRLVGSLGVPLRNRRFLAFAAFVAMLTFATAPSGQFVTLFLVQKMQVGSLAVQVMLLVAPMITQLAVSGLWGRVCDRFGKKVTLTLATVGIAPTALGWAVIAAHGTAGQPLGGWWIVLAFLISAGGGLFWTGIEIANFNYVLDVAGNAKGGHTKQGTTTGAGGGYVAVNSVIVNLAGMAGGLFFGKLASSTQAVSIDAGSAIGTIDVFVILFAASAVLRLVATLVFLPMVKSDAADGREHKSREALRYISANMYNNVQTAILQPVRWLRVRPRDTVRASQA